MNQFNDLRCSLPREWLEDPDGVGKFTGSTSFGNSDVFFVTPFSCKTKHTSFQRQKVLISTKE